MSSMPSTPVTPRSGGESSEPRLTRARLPDTANERPADGLRNRRRSGSYVHGALGSSVSPRFPAEDENGPGLSDRVSCERCKRHKSKCDRGLPACQRCRGAQATCEYPSRRRPGFAAGHRQVLESRIKELEAEVQSLRGKASPQPLRGPAGDADAAGDAAAAATAAATAVAAAAAAAAEAQGQAQGPTPATLMLERPDFDQQQHYSHRESRKPSDWVFQATFQRTRNIQELKPPVDLVVSSISVFFRHIHPCFPFLDTHRVLTELADLKEPTLLHHAMFGASMPFLFDSRLDETKSDSFWKYTKRHIFSETVEEPSYASLEAATILTLDLSSMTNGPQVWGRMALVAKLADQLRTVGGRVLRPSVQADAQDAHVSRPSSRQHARLFWAIYALDSFISITTGQPPALTGHTIRYFMTTRDLAWRTDSGADHAPRLDPCGSRAPATTGMDPESLFLRLLHLLDVARQIHAVYIEYITLPEDDDVLCARWLESFVDCAAALDHSLAGLASTDAEIRAFQARGRRPQPLVILLDVYSHALAIYLHGLLRFASHSAIRSLSSLELVQKSAHACAVSVARIVDSASTYVESMGDQLTWPFCWALWVAARHLLAEAYHDKEDAVSSVGAPAHDFCILLNSLSRMGRSWQISKKYWSLLRRAGDVVDGNRNDAVPSAAENGETQRIRASMADLRIPVSDIEDQFRVDPVCLQRTGSQGTSFDGSHLESDDAMAVAEVAAAVPSSRETGGGSSNAPVDIFSEAVFASTGNFSDNWFSMPLFASSAYQQFLGDQTVEGDWPMSS